MYRKGDKLLLINTKNVPVMPGNKYSGKYGYVYNFIESHYFYSDVGRFLENMIGLRYDRFVLSTKITKILYGVDTGSDS